MWSDFLSEINWGDAIKRAIPAGIGAYVAGNANQRAAQTLAEANQAAAAQRMAGAEKAQARFTEIADRSAPAINYLRGVMADTSITPSQRQRIEDTRRETGNMLSSRLGGRSATAIASRAATNLENSIYDANRGRADRSAAMLAGQNAGALTAAAGNDASLGSDLARITAGTGENIAQAGLSTAQLQGKMLGDALSGGDVMSALRNYVAAEQKGSNYDKWKPGAST